MTPPNALRVEALRVAFGDREGLRSIDLDVAPGERLALLGPSGSGKTSLLRSLAGLQPVLAGRITVDGRDVTRRAPEQRGIVYMHQTPSLFPHLSVLRNVTFPLDVRGHSRAEADRRAREELARVRLEAFADRAPSTLSGGQRHRVALARALAAAPLVLLLDEPFASLDPALRSEVRDAFVRVLFENQGPATIVVTHDVDEAAALGDRVAVLLEGGVAQSGPPAHVFARPATFAVARFLGTTNVMAGRRDAEGVVHTQFGSWRSPGRAGLIHVAVRPTHVRLNRGEMPTESSGVLVSAVAVVDSIHERVSGTFVGLRWPADAAAAPWTAALSGTPPRAGERVTVVIDPRDVHLIDAVDEAPADVR
ncbi:MAG: ABC transporter ATP-binding protein [Vicinamibacterales bacterium]